MDYAGKTFKLKNGAKIDLRLMNEDDFERSYRFFNNLPEQDKTYLRVDVSDPEIVRARMKTSPLENVFRIVAVHEDQIVADASLKWPEFGWMSHVGEIRLIISRQFRRLGLASILYREMFIQAAKKRLEKIEVQMMPRHVGARRCVEKLGFREEGVLTNFVKDGESNTHDLIIMSTDI